MASTKTTRLTDADRLIIAQARAVAALATTDSMRERYGIADGDHARASMTGEAQYLLLELAAIIERLDG
jgi:hypothetical protein